MLRRCGFPNSNNKSKNINHLRKTAKKIGMRYPQIISFYLFGSIARGDADEFSDIDLFILVEDNATDVSLMLTRDIDYKALEDWALNIVEGGLSPLILSKEELINEFDTLIGRIIQEGILLYGDDLFTLINKMPRKPKESESKLLDFVRSL